MFATILDYKHLQNKEFLPFQVVHFHTHLFNPHKNSKIQILFFLPFAEKTGDHRPEKICSRPHRERFNPESTFFQLNHISKKRLIFNKWLVLVVLMRNHLLSFLYIYIAQKNLTGNTLAVSLHSLPRSYLHTFYLYTWSVCPYTSLYVHIYNI